MDRIAFVILDNLRVHHIRAVEGLLEKGRSPEGINLDLRHIRAALRRGEDLGVILIAPKVDMVKAPRRLPRHLTEDHVDRFLAAETNEAFSRIWTFFIWTGVRRKEAHGLRWEDVTLGDRPSALVIGKGDRERVVPLLAPALAAMGEPQASGPVCRSGEPGQPDRQFQNDGEKGGAAGGQASRPAAYLFDLAGLEWGPPKIGPGHSRAFDHHHDHELRENLHRQCP